MPKNFEFIGLRKYDPNATTAERTYTEGIDYYGGDTQVFLTDLSLDNPVPVRIGCLRNLTGGGMFYDMIDTSCYGQLHKSYMQRQLDSDPIEATISAMSEETIETALSAFLGKRTVQMTILFPDSRYINSLVRVERIDPNSPIDSVFEYVITFRRVGTPTIGKGWYSVEYDLHNGRWKNGYKPPLLPYYTSGKPVTVVDGKEYVEPLLAGEAFDKFTAYERISRKEVPITNNQFTITAHTVIEAHYKPADAEFVVMSGNRNSGEGQITSVEYTPFEASLRGAFPESSDRYPVGTTVNLPDKPQLKIDKHWEMVGWTINDKPYGFGEQYLIMDDTVVEGRWQECCIMDFSRGTCTDAVIPQPIRVLKGGVVVVPEFAADPFRHFRSIGWKDAKTNTAYTPGQRVELQSDVTLTASWKPLHYAKYTVDAADDVEGGVLPIDLTAYAAGDEIIMPSLEIEKDGYTFTGWSRASGDVNVYAPGDAYIVTSGDGEEIIFEAVWEEDTET